MLFEKEALPAQPVKQTNHVKSNIY